MIFLSFRLVRALWLSSQRASIAVWGNAPASIMSRREGRRKRRRRQVGALSDERPWRDKRLFRLRANELYSSSLLNSPSSLLSLILPLLFSNSPTSLFSSLLSFPSSFSSFPQSILAFSPMIFSFLFIAGPSSFPPFPCRSAGMVRSLGQLLHASQEHFYNGYASEYLSSDENVTRSSMPF